MVEKLSAENFDRFLPMVAQISKEYASRYRNFVEAEDVAQQLWLWFVSHPNKTRTWLSDESLIDKDRERLFAKSLRNQALDYCLHEKASKTGYEFEDQFWYDKEFVKLILPAALSGDWRRIDKFSSEVKTHKSPSESNDWIAFAADVKRAFESLSKDEQTLVFEFYAQDVSGKDLHDKLGSDRPSSRATMMAANRALRKMVKFLGGDRPWIDKDTELEVETV